MRVGISTEKSQIMRDNPVFRDMGIHNVVVLIDLFCLNRIDYLYFLAFLSLPMPVCHGAAGGRRTGKEVL